MTQVAIPLADLGALNAHARAEGGASRHAIYAYKEAATWALLRAGKATARPVRWRGPCGRCGGDGRFKFWEGGDAACRACDGTGTTSLRFAEIALPDGQRWHHPWDVPRVGFVGFSMLTFALRGDQDDDWWQRIAWEPAGDWAPRAPGARLGGDALVAALNRVEDWVTAPGAIDPDNRWKFERARERMLLYRLDISHRIPAVCYRCGGGEPLASLRVGASGQWPLGWSARICVRCYDAEWTAPRPGAARIWPRTVPEGALSPDILCWIARRPKTRPRDPWADW